MGDEIKEKDSLLDQEPTDAGKDVIEEAYAYEGIFQPTIPVTRPLYACLLQGKLKVSFMKRKYVDLCQC